MREFIFVSNKARTSGNFNEKDLRKAGRMDIICNVIIHAFFISNKQRQDVSLHLIFNGMPDPPKHIHITGEKTPFSKKDISGLIKRALYKYKKGKKFEALPGVYIEKKSFLKLVEELKEQNKNLIILDKSGKNIRKLKNKDLENVVFILGDHEGLGKKETKRVKKQGLKISLGNKTYFSSQTITILHNDLDIREM